MTRGMVKWPWQEVLHMQQLSIAAIKGLFWLGLEVEYVGVMDAGQELHPFASVSIILLPTLHKEWLLRQIKQQEILFLFLPAQECGTLKNPRYGQVVLTGTIFGSTATYSCITGFILVGEQTRTCQANGKWSSRAATCQRKYETSTIMTMTLHFLASFFLSAVSCGYLEDPQYGRVVLTGTNVGATATYSCNTGFILLGDEVRRCQANGKWSGRVPICQRKWLTPYYQLTWSCTLLLYKWLTAYYKLTWSCTMLLYKWLTAYYQLTWSCTLLLYKWLTAYYQLTHLKL